MQNTFTLLDRVNSPEDLKKLSLDELNLLCGEIRTFLIESISKTGGHIGPNLGVVELTVALHYVFNSPQDHIIWDGSYQTYTHKILTGRKGRFATLRQFQGLSGFANRMESSHDSYGAGHTSTSISAALGFAIGRDILGEKENVIAVIGDGAMTGGPAFEGLNNLKAYQSRIIVILNDNEMSISPNVGGIAEYLKKIQSSEAFRSASRDIHYVLSLLPAISREKEKLNFVEGLVEKARKNIKNLAIKTTTGIIFQEMGINYRGPYDGHNLSVLIEVLTQAKETQEPILIHIKTTKGKGLVWAEQNKAISHGVGAFVIGSDGKVEVKKGVGQTYSQFFTEKLIQLARQDNRIAAITAAMAVGTGLTRFQQELPEQFFDVGIAEAHAVLFACGLAARGLKPVVCIYSAMLQRAFDPILHDACIQSLPVVFAMDRGGFAGDDGMTHHGVFDISYLRILPNMVLMAPKDENELFSMLKTAIKYGKGPVAFRFPRDVISGVLLDSEPHPLPIGKGEILREGQDLVLIPVGTMVSLALKAADLLENQGICCSVVNPRFIKPLDAELICSLAEKIGKIVTIEENVLSGGFGSSVLELLEQQNLMGRVIVKRIGIPDRFVDHGKRDLLLQDVGITVERIVDEAKKLASENIPVRGN